MKTNMKNKRCKAHLFFYVSHAKHPDYVIMFFVSDYKEEGKNDR